MKRFFSQVAAVEDAVMFGITLDGRPVRTPARKALRVPTRSLADAMVAEWSAQNDTVDFRTMPLNGLANAAIDRIDIDRERFAAGLAAYAQSDAIAYRADGPAPLVDRQAELWNPLLDWVSRRYDLTLLVGTGVTPFTQPAETIARLSNAVSAFDTFRLAGLSPLVTVSGSLIIGLAVAEGAMTVETGFAAAQLDEDWQAEQWGQDELALKARQARRADFYAGARFLALLSD